MALGFGFLVVAATYGVPYVIGEPDPTGGRLLFGTDYKGRRFYRLFLTPRCSLRLYLPNPPAPDSKFQENILFDRVPLLQPKSNV